MTTTKINTPYSLDQLTPGESAVVDTITSESSERWSELGLRTGSLVSVIQKAIGGDPILIDVQGLRYGIRIADAKNIHLKLF